MVFGSLCTGIVVVDKLLATHCSPIATLSSIYSPAGITEFANGSVINYWRQLVQQSNCETNNEFILQI